MVVDTFHERYEFHCEPCDCKWQITYEVHELEDDSLHYFYSTGIPATPPTSGRLCPNCWQPAYEPFMVDGPLTARSHS
jgi:hypothetical protein